MSAWRTSSSDRSDPDAERALQELRSRAAAVDGASAFNEASLLGARDYLAVHADGRLVAAATAYEAGELVVDPDWRRRGIGDTLSRALVARLRAEGLDSAWAHGDAPGAAALAARLGFVRARELLHLGRPLTPDSPTADAGTPRRAPVPDARDAAGAPRDPGVAIGPMRDDELDAIVAVNALAFRDHPEQGAMDRADAEARLASPGHDRANVLVARSDDDHVLGFCWLKLADDVEDSAAGEIYVLGVHPDAAGRGLGGALLDAGLARLRALGRARAELYVEGDNERALRLYRSRGFERLAIDVLYRAAR